MPHPPRWVDGSGLSRYNLFTPESIVWLLRKMRSEYGENRIFGLLAQPGAPGTLQGWSLNVPRPWLYAKTGTLSNNHNLSGYLKTRSGRTVVFSFMNNHYLESTDSVRLRMQRILNRVRESY